MGDRRPLSSYLRSGDYDQPPASITLAENVTTRLDRLRRTLERHREESRRVAEATRHPRWDSPPSLRRRRVRPAGNHTLTFEGHAYDRSDESLDEDEEGSRPRTAKRRKLDNYSSPPETTAFKYGHYGQVETGRLRLKFVCTNGGVHDERGPIYYGPNNVVRHDQSVYCSKESRCHILLKHHDSKPFCLEKLHIIAPNNGFTAPVKQGIVSIAMGIDELLPTINAAIATDPHHPNPPTPTTNDLLNERLSLMESLHDPEVSRAVSNPPGGVFSPFEGLRTDQDQDDDNDYDFWSRPHGPESPTVDADWSAYESTRRQDGRTEHQVCEESSSEALTDSGVRVTMLNDEDPVWPEEPTTAAVIADRQRRLRSMRIDDEDANGWDPRFRAAYSRLRRGLRPEHHGSREDTPDQKAGDKNATKQSDVIRVPFRIKTGRNKIALKFDPPVSGTYILLQLQTPSSGRNIDIQSVIACGFAGPRFFPAQEYR